MKHRAHLALLVFAITGMACTTGSDDASLFHDNEPVRSARDALAQGDTPEVDSLLLRGDANGDGEIDRQEWRGPSQAFARVDTDNSGSLSRPELERLIDQLPEAQRNALVSR